MAQIGGSGKPGAKNFSRRGSGNWARCGSTDHFLEPRPGSENDRRGARHLHEHIAAFRIQKNRAAKGVVFQRSCRPARHPALEGSLGFDKDDACVCNGLLALRRFGISELREPTVHIRLQPSPLTRPKMEKCDIRRSGITAGHAQLSLAHRGGRNLPFPFRGPLKRIATHREFHGRQGQRRNNRRKKTNQCRRSFHRRLGTGVGVGAVGAGVGVGAGTTGGMVKGSIGPGRFSPPPGGCAVVSPKPVTF